MNNWIFHLFSLFFFSNHLAHYMSGSYSPNMNPAVRKRASPLQMAEFGSGCQQCRWYNVDRMWAPLHDVFYFVTSEYHRPYLFNSSRSKCIPRINVEKASSTSDQKVLTICLVIFITDLLFLSHIKLLSSTIYLKSEVQLWLDRISLRTHVV